MVWNPTLYSQFSQRRAPVDDLLHMIVAQPHMSVIDLGCGDGQLTRELAQHLAVDRVVAVDRSPEMIEAARDNLSSLDAEVVQADLAELVADTGLHESFDLVVSNAALQWLPDHGQLMPLVLKLVKAGGQLALQIPSNLDHPAQRLLGEISGHEPFVAFTQGYVRPSHVLRIDQYAELLYKHRFEDIVAIEKVYGHELEDAHDLVQWLQGTGMIPYLERLPADHHPEFIAAYETALEQLMPGSPILYAQKQILLVARKEL